MALRLLATGIAVGLILLDPVEAPLLALCGYGLLSSAAIALSPTLRASRVAWLVDMVVVLVFVALSGDWRSPFYLMWLTTLALPAVQLPLRQAGWLAILAPLTYLVIALVGGPAPGHLRPLTSETLVIHISLPGLLVGGLAAATRVLARLHDERERREVLAIETERQRIAWELHDSAKQRLHAAHLLVSSLEGRVEPDLEAIVQRASVELESASADMDTSLAELRSPLEGRPLHVALAARARELQTEDGPRIDVRGEAPRLAPLVGAHVYRIACEALINALRHAEARTIDVTIEPLAGGLRLGVVDDGRGFPSRARRRTTGILAMRSRAASIGASLSIAPRGDRPGTRVVMELANDRTPGGTT